VDEPSGETQAKRDRRSQVRHGVDTSAAIYLIKTGSRLEGRILDLSLSGCRIRTGEKIPMGIYTRVETGFYLNGLPFRLGGVIQAIHDSHNLGIRFLDMSERSRQQVAELIAEIEEKLRAGE
jgi:c-di-GMP-binding flagellar brake protein YcgR